MKKVILLLVIALPFFFNGSPLFSKNKTKDKFTETIVGELYQQTKFYSIKSDVKNELWSYSNGIYSPNGECLIKEYVRNKIMEKQAKNNGFNQTKLKR